MAPQPATMKAMVLRQPGRPLEPVHLPVLEPGPGQVRGAACGVCRTDLHIVDGELAEPFPLGEANEALTRLRDGRLRGVAVLTPG